MAGIVLLVLKSCTTGILGTIRNGPNFAGNPRTSSARRLLRVVLRWGTVVHVRRCLAEVPGCLLPLQLDGLAVAPVVLYGCPLLLVFLRHLAEARGCRFPLRLDWLVDLRVVLYGCPLLLVCLRHLAEARGCRFPLRLDRLVDLRVVLYGCPLLLVCLRHLLPAEGLERCLPLRPGWPVAVVAALLHRETVLAGVLADRRWRLLSVLVPLRAAFLSRVLLLGGTQDSCSSLA